MNRSKKQFIIFSIIRYERWISYQKILTQLDANILWSKTGVACSLWTRICMKMQVIEWKSPMKRKESEFNKHIVQKKSLQHNEPYKFDGISYHCRDLKTWDGGNETYSTSPLLNTNFSLFAFFLVSPLFWGEYLISRPSITCLNEHDCVFLFFYLTVILVGLLWRFSSVERRMRIVTKQKTLHRTSNHRTITLIGCPCVTSVYTRQSNSGSAVMARQPHCSLQCTPSFNIRLQKIQFFFQISKSMIIIIEYK